MTLLNHVIAIAQGLFIVYLMYRIHGHDEELEELRNKLDKH